MTVIVIDTDDDDFAPPALESVTVTVTGKVPCANGVPEITPVDALSDSPSAGRPMARHMSVPEPPWDCNVRVYVLPAVPAPCAVTCACVVETPGSAFTVIVTLPVMEDCFRDVAVIVVVPVAPEAANVT